jgi:hypothetical protein
MTHPGVLHLFLGDGVVLRHLCFSVPAHTPLRCVCTGLRRWRLPDAWSHGSLYPCIPRTSSAPLRMYGATEIASSRRMGPWVSLSLHPPHILRSAAYVRGYRDSVFQTHGIMGLSILASSAHPPHRCVCTGFRR